MACRFFEENGLARCNAVDGSLTPSLFERERYCHAEPERCPTLRALLAQGRPITEARYWALWLSPRDEQSEAMEAAAGP
jgi:hypothetical protein